MALLEVRNLKKSYGDKTIIDDINIDLNKGETVSIIGESGAGKTTLFHCISGLEAPDFGSIKLLGEDIAGKPGKVSYMLQKDLMLPHKKIIDNVALPLVVSGVKKDEAREMVGPYFAEFGIEGCEMQYPSQLSGGMRQRAAFLRTFMQKKEAVLLDEPFSALDTITKQRLHKWYVAVLEKYNLSTLLITHDIEEAVVLSDRVFILSGKPGRITKEIVIDRKGVSRDDFIFQPDFLEYKKEILEILKV